MLKSKQEIKQWLDKMNIKHYTINPDLSVDVDGDVNISNQNIKVIPIQFGKVGGNFWCSNNKLTSLEHCPTLVGGDFYCNDNKLTSLKDIHKQIKQVSGGMLCDPNPIKSHILGVFFIKGLKRFMIENKNIQQIVNKHLTGDRDVHQCQEELIKAGFAEYAKL